MGEIVTLRAFEARHGEPFRHMLSVIPDVELFLHVSRRVSRDNEEAFAHRNPEAGTLALLFQKGLDMTHESVDTFDLQHVGSAEQDDQARPRNRISYRARRGNGRAKVELADDDQGRDLEFRETTERIVRRDDAPSPNSIVRDRRTPDGRGPCPRRDPP